MRKDIRKYAGPGHWNDLDMMEVGNEFSDAENRSHFAMWSILASPLIMGNDLSQKFANLKNDLYEIRDLFNYKDLGDTSMPLKAKIGVRDVLMLRLVRQ